MQFTRNVRMKRLEVPKTEEKESWNPDLTRCHTFPSFLLSQKMRGNFDPIWFKRASPFASWRWKLKEDDKGGEMKEEKRGKDIDWSHSTSFILFIVRINLLEISHPIFSFLSFFFPSFSDPTQSRSSGLSTDWPPHSWHQHTTRVVIPNPKWMGIFPRLWLSSLLDWFLFH